MMEVEEPWTVASADAALGPLAGYAQGPVYQHPGGVSLFFYRDRNQWALHRSGGSIHHIEPLTDEFDAAQPPFDYAVMIAHARLWMHPYPHYSQAKRGIAPTTEEDAA
jgi:hypothetical protein